MSRVAPQYICQTAANAIISEIGHYRVSTDALQVINQFLDEFLVLLLSSSLSLDLSRIKAVVFTLLPSTLGKNAIVEAELEVKTFTETEAIDYETYERMRSLGNSGPFPLEATLPLLRDKCLEFCTLADKDAQGRHNKSIKQGDIFISPIVAIYVTTVLEHIAEYVLTAIAMTAEHDDTEYIRVNQVFLALIDDIQVGGVFYRMPLREKLEKRALALGYKPRVSRALTPTPQRYSNITVGSTQGSEFLDISFDDMDIGYEEDEKVYGSQPTTLTAHDHLSVSGYSMKSSISTPHRPTSIMSNSTSNGTISTATGSTNSKKSFKLFKQYESAGNDYSSQQHASVYDPDAPAMNFEELIRSGNTMKVSLTPNRLRSIEVEDQTSSYPVQPKTSWERRSTSNLRKSSAPSSRSGSPLPALPPSMATSRKDASPSSYREFDPRPMASVSEEPGEAHSSAKAHSTQPRRPNRPEIAKFENPRDAPKPPRPQVSSSMPWIPPSPTKAASSPTKAVPSPTKMGQPLRSASPVSTTTRVPGPRSFETSPPRTPSPAPVRVPSPAPVSPPQPSPTHAPTLAKAQTVPVPLPKSLPSQEPPSTTPTTKPEVVTEDEAPATPKKNQVTVLRRSSSSSRKSRENLRRQREKEEQAMKTNDDTPELPSSPKASPRVSPKGSVLEKSSPHLTKTTQSSPVSSARNVNESVESIALPSPQASESSHSESKSTRDYESDKGSLRGESKPSSVTSLDHPDRKVHFGSVDHLDTLKSEHPERPSSIVAKRMSMTGTSRRQSLHESFALQGDKAEVEATRQRLSAAGSVEQPTKALEETTKPGDDNSGAGTAKMAHHKAAPQTSQPPETTLSDSPDEADQEDLPIPRPRTPSKSVSTPVGMPVRGTSPTPPVRTPRTTEGSSVLDKVLKFERASTLDVSAQQHHRQHRASAYFPRRERFLYLQREPGLIERPVFSKPRPLTIDAAVQTDPLPEPEPEPEPKRPSPADKTGPPALMITTEDDMGVTTRKELDVESASEHGSEHGLVEGDEEWFLQDDEWEDTQDQEIAVVEWLLGDA